MIGTNLLATSPARLVNQVVRESTYCSARWRVQRDKASKRAQGRLDRMLGKTKTLWQVIDGMGALRQEQSFFVVQKSWPSSRESGPSFDNTSTCLFLMDSPIEYDRNKTKKMLWLRVALFTACDYHRPNGRAAAAAAYAASHGALGWGTHPPLRASILAGSVSCMFFLNSVLRINRSCWPLGL